MSLILANANNKKRLVRN